MTSLNDLVTLAGGADYNTGKLLLLDGDSQDVVGNEAGTWNEALIARAEAELEDE